MVKTVLTISAFLFVLMPFCGKAQEHALVFGRVISAGSGETLPGASVFLMPSLEGTNADVNGEYRLKVKPGAYTLKSSFVGYSNYSERLILAPGDSIKRDIQLGVITLTTVEISANKNRATESTAMGVNSLDMATIQRMPAFLGEVDLLKSIQLLPGVQSAGEGNSGFFVRGGGPDQNLILFDDAVVYNASHLLGFFSVFNSDAIESVDLYKGAMPAQFGERLASVIDVKQRSGNKEKFSGRGGVGLISSRLTLEGPIKKNKSSFLISGRRTYIDALITPFINPESQFGGSRYYFYDLNGRADWELKNGGRLYLSGYWGNDVFDFNSPESEFKTTVGWGNRILSGGYQKLIGKEALLKIGGSFTSYRFSFTGSQDDFELEVNSTITDYRLKPELSFKIGNHRLKTGLLYTFHDISPNNSRAEQGETLFDLGELQQYYSHEGAVFLSDEFDLTDRWRFDIGLRFSGFAHTGPFTRYLLDDLGNKTDTIGYESGDIIADYFGLEPRLMVRFKIDEDEAIKAAFTQNYQYIHLANISPLALPTDVWLPSTEIVQPQLGRQYSLGYFRNFLNGDLEASVETYYKSMNNLVEYKENSQPSDGVDNNEDNLLTFGKGRAYGIEFLLRKTAGKTTGWIGYTLSRTEREFEEINNGNVYPATFDRRHDLAIVFAHQISEKWSLSSNFVYGTGRAITLPVSGYFIENRLVYRYEERNSFRMKPYHRLDISATYSPENKKETVDPISGETVYRDKKFRSEWVFSIYNVYSRLNPYFYYFDTSGRTADNNFKVTAKQVSLFPILPSITWNFIF